MQMTIRKTIRGNLALVTFLWSYAVFTVAGNLVYLVPGGDTIAHYSIKQFSLSAFDTRGSAGYMALLMLPFVVAPPVAFFTRVLIGKFIASRVRKVDEITSRDFSVIFALAFCYVAYSFWRSGAAGMLQQGGDFLDAVRLRFDLHESLGYLPQATLKALLLFLACYAFVCALKQRQPFWIIASIVAFVALSVFLIMLNMKWPLVLYYSALTVTVFLHAQRHPFLGTIAAATLTLVAYFTISALLLRPPGIHQTAPSQPPQMTQTAPLVAPPQTQDAAISNDKQFSIAARALNFIDYTTEATIQYWQYFAVTLLNRMALPYPFYFDTFTREGNICGTIADRIERKVNACHPSNLIYSRMFHDEFSGRGTAPQAVHITGYALDGWLGALLELTLASIVIGCFISVPSTATPMMATLSLIGGLSGYYFSQLPIEGAIIYDHSVLWPVLFVALYTILRRLISTRTIFRTAPGDA